VLMVDSQPASRAPLRRRLRDSQHRVAQAHSGAAALKRLKKEMPDVVILDHLMPGQTGVETAPRLRAAGYAGPIVLLSGSAPDGTDAARFPMDVWPISHSDEALLVRLIDGYSRPPAPQPTDPPVHQGQRDRNIARPRSAKPDRRLPSRLSERSRGRID
jgi:CheY-like chemotaxis protein